MTNKTQRLAGRRVAITGGARGIGRATAEAFIAEGAVVAIGDIDAELVEKTAAEIAANTGGKIVGLQLDVTDRDAFAAFVDTVDAEFGGLDVLVNNAGIMPTGAFLDESDAVTDRQMAINVFGVITGSKLAAARFADQGSGHIVNVASIAGIAGAPGIAVYCATKHAVVGLGSSLYQELAPFGVKVSTICPSYVRTELMAGLSTNPLLEKIGVVNPEDIARGIISAVVADRGGQREIPALTGQFAKTLNLVPDSLRARITRLFGSHEVNLNADESVRGTYRARTESV